MISGFSGLSNTILNKAGLNRLRTGDILTVKILQNKEGLIKAVINGKTLNIRGSLDLAAGSSIRVKAEWSGNTLMLNRLHTDESVNGMIRSAGFVADDTTFILIQTARRAGLHLSDENLKLLKKFLQKNSRIGPKEARLAVEFMKKGIEPQYVPGIFEGREQNHDENKKKMLLFNSLKSGSELWFVVPFSFSYGNKTIPGSLRIKKNTENHRIISFVIEAEFRGSSLFFISDEFERCGERRARLLYEGKLSRREKVRLNNGLNEILGNLRFKTDDNIIERCAENVITNSVFDGFGFDEGPMHSGIEEMA